MVTINLVFLLCFGSQKLFLCASFLKSLCCQMYQFLLVFKRHTILHLSRKQNDRKNTRAESFYFPRTGCTPIYVVEQLMLHITSNHITSFISSKFQRKSSKLANFHLFQKFRQNPSPRPPKRNKNFPSRSLQSQNLLMFFFYYLNFFCPFFTLLQQEIMNHL